MTIYRMMTARKILLTLHIVGLCSYTDAKATFTAVNYYEYPRTFECNAKIVLSCRIQPYDSMSMYWNKSLIADCFKTTCTTYPALQGYMVFTYDTSNGLFNVTVDPITGKDDTIPYECQDIDGHATDLITPIVKVISNLTLEITVSTFTNGSNELRVTSGCVYTDTMKLKWIGRQAGSAREKVIDDNKISSTSKISTCSSNHECFDGNGTRQIEATGLFQRATDSNNYTVLVCLSVAGTCKTNMQPIDGYYQLEADGDHGANRRSCWIQTGCVLGIVVLGEIITIFIYACGNTNGILELWIGQVITITSGIVADCAAIGYCKIKNENIEEIHSIIPCWGILCIIVGILAIFEVLTIGIFIFITRDPIQNLTAGVTVTSERYSEVKCTWNARLSRYKHFVIEYKTKTSGDDDWNTCTNEPEEKNGVWETTITQLAIAHEYSIRMHSKIYMQPFKLSCSSEKCKVQPMFTIKRPKKNYFEFKSTTVTVTFTGEITESPLAPPVTTAGEQQCTRPDVPSDVSIQQESLTDRAVNICWKSFSDNNVTYIVKFRKIGETNWQDSPDPVEYLRGGSYKYRLERLRKKTMYEVKVTACNGILYTDSGSITLTTEAEPDAPTDVSIEQETLTDRAVNICWKSFSMKNVTYSVKYRKIGEQNWQAIINAVEYNEGGSYTYCLKPLEKNTTYEVKVTACNGTLSTDSGSITLTTEAEPDAPTDVSFEQKTLTDRAVNICWKSCSKKNVTYSVKYRKIGDQKWQSITNPVEYNEGWSYTYCLEPLEKKTAYEVKVTACNGALSTDSGSITLTTEG